MHYYQFNIGDYQSHTAHLEPLEDLAYRRMLDWCYLHERPLPDDIEQISKLIRMRSHSDCIASVLREFFVCTPDGWWKERIGKEIEKTGEKSRKASESAKARWQKEKGDANALPAQSERNATHNTLPKTQDTVHKKKPQDKPADLLFDEFWKAYPKKQGKDLAKTSFVKRKVSKELLQQMLQAIDQQKSTDQWKKESGQFIPAPATWLNQGRWQDEITSAYQSTLPRCI